MKYDVDILKIGIFAGDANNIIKRYTIENENFGYEDYDIINSILSKIKIINNSQTNFELIFKNCSFPVIEFNNIKNEYEFIFINFINCKFNKFNINTVELPTARLKFIRSRICDYISIKDSNLKRMDFIDNSILSNIDIDNFKCRILKLENINTRLRVTDCNTDELFCKIINSDIGINRFIDNEKFVFLSIHSYISIIHDCDIKEFINTIETFRNSIITTYVNGYNISSMLIHFMFDLDICYLPFVDMVAICCNDRKIVYHTLDNFANMVENEYKHSYEEYETNYKDNPEKYKEVYGDDIKMAEQHRDYKDYASLVSLFTNCRDKYIERTSHK